ncbi:MAG TPA: hypothetical protein PK760_12370, partial [Flavobacteriales bacterium]|nr:hypothetical protein [Flavobacteriales bacterium]
VNKTSYVEAVGLLDAHLTQGRWSFGVRGGPTFGWLTQWRGEVPNGAGEPTDYNDVAFHQMVVGWTARGYIRYRFSSAWSVGLEPTMRGQLNDSFDQNGVKRRSNGAGVMLSISLLLR